MRLFIFYFVFTGVLISQENLSELNAQKWVDSVYNSLSLEEKIGQLFTGPNKRNFKPMSERH